MWLIRSVVLVYLWSGTADTGTRAQVREQMASCVSYPKADMGLPRMISSTERDRDDCSNTNAIAG